MSAHPHDDDLVKWLETERPSRVGRHVESCEACMERVDTLSDLGGLVSGLARVSAPPGDLHARTTGGVHGRLAAEESVGAFLDLFSIGWQTAAVMLDATPPTPTAVDGPPPSDQDSDQEDQPDG